MKKINTKYLIIAGAILIITLLVVLSRQRNMKNIFSGGGKSQVYEVVLTEDGYKPEKITIKKGDTVTFTTKRNQFHWPASNLHPIHDIYPEFDPKEPVSSDKSWSFRFDKVGTWKFHDHLSPYYTGTIIVQ